MLASLENLFLNENQITDEGCAALASALRSGALPALKALYLDENPASNEARRAACEIPDARTDDGGEVEQDADADEEDE